MIKTSFSFLNCFHIQGERLTGKDLVAVLWFLAYALSVLVFVFLQTDFPKIEIKY